MQAPLPFCHLSAKSTAKGGKRPPSQVLDEGLTPFQQKVLQALEKCMISSEQHPVGSHAVKLHLELTKPEGLVSSSLIRLAKKGHVKISGYQGRDGRFHRTYSPAQPDPASAMKKKGS